MDENIALEIYPTLALPTMDIPQHTDPDSGVHYIFDRLRHKWIEYTPEEWVRQNIGEYLFTVLDYPRALAKYEYSIKVGTSKRRCDIVVFDSSAVPLILVECKAPSVAISQKAFNQLAAYFSVLPSAYLLLTNGLQHYCCKTSAQGNFLQVETIPTYAEALTSIY
jgi:hypothetical protein